MPPKPKVQPRQRPSKAAASTSAEDGSAVTPSKNVEMSEAAGSLEQQPSISRPVSGTTSEPASCFTSTATQSSKRPVQRLASLNPRTTTPSASGSRPAGILKFQPKSFIRRSKEEREAQEKAEAERRQARLAAAGASGLSAGQRGGPNGRGAGRGGVGGGMNRFNVNRYSGGQASGALGGGTLGEARQKRPGMGPSMSGGGSSYFGIEPPVKREKDGDVIMGSGGTRPMIKRENGKVSSDDDFDTTEGPRMNIEHINLISDDNEEDELEKPTQHRHKQPGRDTKAHVSSLKPVRINRHEHVERSVGVNTEASSITMADHRRKAKERALAEGGLFLSDDEAAKRKLNKPKGKGKGKAKDVTFVKDERRWQGVYPEDEDILNIPMIKEEPKDDLEPTVIDENLPTASSPLTGVETAPEERSPKASRKAEDSPLLRRKKPRRKGHKAVRPVLQTTEDCQEWARYQEDLYLLSEELVSLKTTPLSISPRGFINTEVEGTKADAGSETEAKKDRKQGLVYLFQLPPIIPPLATPVEKENGEEAAAAKKASLPPAKTEQKPVPSSMPSPSNPFLAEHKTDPKIKPDPDSKSNMNPISSTDVILGKAGKLAVFASGSVKATWGGVGIEVGRGGDGGILQEVVLWEDGKQGAQAMGQVAGGFVGVPQWGGMIK